MCDTLGFLGSTAYFAKNSDRSPNEPQILEFYPAAEGLSGELQVTYTSLPQAKRTHAVLLSRPAWMWGAEMGINDCGVCIGNEAVFTRGKYGKTGLTGMDLVRLALERSSTAIEARECILSLLEEHGQGGNCGFDHNFYYDNAFLIMDAGAIFVVETAGRQWVWKAYSRASISNRLSIRGDGDRYGGVGSGNTPYDFFAKHVEPVYTYFSGSARRRGQTQCSLQTASGLADCMAALRQHDTGVTNPFAAGSVSSACMHFGGMVGDHSTASMVVQLKEDSPAVIWSTGASAPCVSLFKPWCFGSKPIAPVFAAGQEEEAQNYWLEAETFRRALIGRTVPAEFYAQRDEIQNRWIHQAESMTPADFPEFSRQCLDEEKAFFARWNPEAFPKADNVSRSFLKRWNQKNQVLGPCR